MELCKHLKQRVGQAECGCAGTFGVYHCALFETPAIPFPAEPIYLHHNNGKIEENPEVLQCTNCTQNTSSNHPTLPKKC